MTPLFRKLVAEFLGTLILLATVVGSGVMGIALSKGNDGVALLANAGATAAALYSLISILGPVSGAHFNPAVTLVARLRGEIGGYDAALYIATQLVAAILGVLLAHAMFDLPLVQPGTHVRAGAAQALSEGVATFGLLLTILLGKRFRADSMAALVASYIFAAYWFTASTSFANPAVTLARSLTQTFAGIRPEDVAVFVAAQLVGAAAACVAALPLLGALETSRRPESVH
ncbi:MAG: aquaporin family protein [Proteobacteria bacterium]|uniref:MIP/aquaporin family protein n=1 Tax=Rudaea sp. TaxID=2136325 RepID=UPI00321FBCF8|nr:aquaporin family protein [Pseudomonadota bacterium]